MGRVGTLSRYVEPMNLGLMCLYAYYAVAIYTANVLCFDLAGILTRSLACRDSISKITSFPRKASTFMHVDWPPDGHETFMNDHSAPASTHSLACRDSISKIASFVRRTSSLAYVDWPHDGHEIS